MAGIGKRLVESCRECLLLKFIHDILNIGSHLTGDKPLRRGFADIAYKFYEDGSFVFFEDFSGLRWSWRIRRTGKPAAKSITPEETFLSHPLSRYNIFCRDQRCLAALLNDKSDKFGYLVHLVQFLI